MLVLRKTIARGVVLSDLKVPGHEKTNIPFTRWLDSDSKYNQGLHKLYDRGQRWNNHVYCVPEGSKVGSAINCLDEEDE